MPYYNHAGCRTRGAATRERYYNGRQEKDDTLALTLAVGELLQERGLRCPLHTHYGRL